MTRAGHRSRAWELTLHTVRHPGAGHPRDARNFSPLLSEPRAGDAPARQPGAQGDRLWPGQGHRPAGPRGTVRKAGEDSLDGFGFLPVACCVTATAGTLLLGAHHCSGRIRSLDAPAPPGDRLGLLARSGLVNSLANLTSTRASPLAHGSPRGHAACPGSCFVSGWPRPCSRR
jgi:hypothetical protein